MKAAIGLIFDLDGTLVDTRQGIASSIEYAISRILPHRKVDPKVVTIGPPLRVMLRRLLGSVTSAEVDALEAVFREQYDTEGYKQSRLYPGVASTLNSLVALGLPCFVLTNKPKTPTNLILNYYGVAKYITAAVCPDSVVPPFVSKLEAAKSIMSRFDLTRNSILVGDSSDDAEAAHGASIRFVAATYGYGNAHRITQYSDCEQILLFSEILKFAPPRTLMLT
jgi:phosphoglycolate phosphatase